MSTTTTTPPRTTICSRCPGARCPDCPFRPELLPDPARHPLDHAHRGLLWQRLLSGAWEFRDRGDVWVIYLDAAGWRVACYPWGQTPLPQWAGVGPASGNYRSSWPTAEAAMDAVTDVLTAGAVGAGI